VATRDSDRMKEISDLLDISEAIINKLGRIENERPDLLEKVHAGELSVDAAISIINVDGEAVIMPTEDFMGVAYILASAFDQGEITKDEIDGLFNLLEEKLEDTDE